MMLVHPIGHSIQTLGGMVLQPLYMVLCYPAVYPSHALAIISPFLIYWGELLCPITATDNTFTLMDLSLSSIEPPNWILVENVSLYFQVSHPLCCCKHLVTEYTVSKLVRMEELVRQAVIQPSDTVSQSQ